MTKRKQPHVWMLEIEDDGKWVPWDYQGNILRKHAAEWMRVESEVWPNVKFRIAKYVREAT